MCALTIAVAQARRPPDPGRAGLGGVAAIGKQSCRTAL